MKHRKFNWLFLGLLGCSEYTLQSNSKPAEPYGAWLSEQGFVLVLTRNLQYSVCDSQQCDLGKFNVTASHDVIIPGFFSGSVGNRLGARAFGSKGAFEKFRDAVSTKNDLVFTISEKLPARIVRNCKITPCVPIGDTDHGVFLTLRKLS